MGLMVSVVLTYAGVHEAVECMKHILSGIVPNTEPNFQDLIEYYTTLLKKSHNANSSTAVDWIKESGQGYLFLTEDKNGKLKSVAVNYYGNQTNSTALLFSTKISSFGQESLDDSEVQTNGDYRSERYIQTKTILTNTSDSIKVGHGYRSSSRENISDLNTLTSNSVEPENDGEQNGSTEKLKWHYRPMNSPTNQQTLPPEIHFQSFDDDKRGVYSEDFLRSLDGIKFRPLQRSDPSGRRRSFKKRHSSSSNSSRESRASREEELKMFTSLEEAEFERMNNNVKVEGFGSTPNLSARSYSRSRSRENSKEGRREHWSVEASGDSTESADDSTKKQLLSEVPQLNSFEEDTKEVIEEEDEVDFWANSGD
ncbi:unnamed protein product [Arctia plantaginis]|uniref:Uncharacterized protein n=1 Tax=Arctia plantaginis TaxID=874455 RepID=A0A8S1AF91_ARCPL|nr:unnamed protein product [Arctia plantaginis]